VNKSYIFIISLCFSDLVLGQDIRKFIDPWGNRVNTVEINQKRESVQSQLNNRNTQLQNLQIDHNNKAMDLAAKKNKIEITKGNIRQLLEQEEVQLKNLIQKQQEQIAHTTALLDSSKNTQFNLKKMVDGFVEIKSNIISLRLLQPIFENTSQNRKLWLKVLKNLEANKENTAEEYQVISLLKNQIQQSSNWFSQTEVLMTDFLRPLEDLNQAIPQSFAQSLLAEFNFLVANIQSELEIQNALLEVLNKIKISHDSMMQIGKL